MIALCIEVPRQHYDIGGDAFDCSAQLQHCARLEVNGAIRYVQPLHRSEPENSGDALQFVTPSGNQFSFVLWRIFPWSPLKPATSVAIENDYDMQFGEAAVAQEEPSGANRLVVWMRGDNKNPLP
jgi:hypothetical protein